MFKGTFSNVKAQIIGNEHVKYTQMGDMDVSQYFPYKTVVANNTFSIIILKDSFETHIYRS